jgi:hypothetical protein
VIESARARIVADPARRKKWWADYYGKNSDKVKADTVKWQKAHPHVVAWRSLLNTNGDWHIDHIRPLSSFPSDADTRMVNALDNLQPLWATTRVIDGVLYEGNLNKNGRWL